MERRVLAALVLALVSAALAGAGLASLSARVAGVEERQAVILDLVNSTASAVRDTATAVSNLTRVLAQLARRVDSLDSRVSQLEEAARALQREGGGGPLVLVGSDGVPVVLPGPAERIVSLYPPATRVLVELEAADYLVGVDSESAGVHGVPPGAAVVGPPGSPRVAAILELRPDLVVAGADAAGSIRGALAPYGVQVLALNATTPAGLYAAILLLGAATGHEEEASALAGALHSRILGVAGETAGLERVAVAVLLWSGPGSVVEAGPGTWPASLAAAAGGEPLGPQGYTRVAAGDVRGQGPEVVVFLDLAGNASYREVAGWLGAVDARVYLVKGSYARYIAEPGPDAPTGLAVLAAVLHPEAYGLDPEAVPHTLTPETFRPPTG